MSPEPRTPARRPGWTVQGRSSVTLGLAIATAKVSGPQASLEIVQRLPESNHRRYAAAGHLRAPLGQGSAARADFLRAAEMTHSLPEQRYVHRLAADCAEIDVEARWSP